MTTEGETSQSIIRPKCLELIAREIGDLDSGSNLVQFLLDCGVKMELIEYPNTKWRMLYSVLTALASSQKKEDIKTLLTIIEQASHPLMHKGDKALAKKTTEKFNSFLEYDDFFIDKGTIWKELQDPNGGFIGFYDKNGNELEIPAYSILPNKVNKLYLYWNELIKLTKFYFENKNNQDEEINDIYFKIIKVIEETLSKGCGNLKEKYKRPFRNMIGCEFEIRKQGLTQDALLTNLNDFLGEITETSLPDETSIKNLIADDNDFFARIKKYYKNHLPKSKKENKDREKTKKLTFPKDADVIEEYLWVINNIEEERQRTPNNEPIAYPVPENALIASGVPMPEQETLILRKLEQDGLIEITNKQVEGHHPYAVGVVDTIRAVIIPDLKKFEDYQAKLLRLKKRTSESHQEKKADKEVIEEMNKKLEEQRKILEKFGKQFSSLIPRNSTTALKLYEEISKKISEQLAPLKATLEEISKFQSTAKNYLTPTLQKLTTPIKQMEEAMEALRGYDDNKFPYSGVDVLVSPDAIQRRQENETLSELREIKTLMRKSLQNRNTRKEATPSKVEITAMPPLELKKTKEKQLIRKTNLKSMQITYNDDKAVIKIGELSVALPPYKNEHYFCQAIWEHKVNEPVDWSIVYNKMTGYCVANSEKPPATKERWRSVYDTMRAVNERIKEIINTDDNLFVWQEKTIKRNY